MCFVLNWFLCLLLILFLIRCLGFDLDYVCTYVGVHVIYITICVRTANSEKKNEVGSKLIGN